MARNYTRSDVRNEESGHALLARLTVAAMHCGDDGTEAIKRTRKARNEWRRELEQAKEEVLARLAAKKEPPTSIFIIEELQLDETGLFPRRYKVIGFTLDVDEAQRIQSNTGEVVFEGIGLQSGTWLRKRFRTLDLISEETNGGGE